jgi:D-alanyl-D-alanine carboxypeptidase
MASSTKIMSGLVALRYYRPDAELTIKSTNVPPAIVGYPLGEKVKFLDVLYGMFLPSGNDAALAVAQNYPGGEKAFVTAMNKKAYALSLYNTHFSDSSGLDDSGDYTTVVDLARLAAEAIKNPVIRTVVATKEKQTTNSSHTRIYSLTNINELLGKYGVNGIKTGFTPFAGGILVTSSKQNGHTIITVVMKSDDRFGDTAKLLSALSGNITYLPILP